MEYTLQSLGGPGHGVPTADVVIQGPPLQVPLSQGTVEVQGALSIGLTGTVAAGGTLTSALFPTFGCSQFVFGVTSTQAGTITLTRYIDAAGTVPIAAAASTALLAATAGVLMVVDGRASMSARIAITNSGGSAATLTAVAGLMRAT